MTRLVALGLCCLAFAATAHAFKGVDVTGQGYGGDFHLTGHDGRARSAADFAGKVVVITFGYTHCPDVCPTTLASLAATLRELGKDAERVQVLFVTVDPGRDTRKVLAAYVTAFDPRFIALSGSASATRQVAREYHVFYRKVGDSFDHSSGAYAVDSRGRTRLFFRETLSGADMAYDIRQLLME